MSYAIKFAVHLMLVFCAFVAAYALRRGLGPEWWLTNPEAAAVLIWGAMYAIIGGACEALYRTERTAWRFSSVYDVAMLAQSTGLTALTFLALIFLSNRAISLPRSTLVLSWLLSLFALVGVRLVWRLVHDPSLLASMTTQPRNPNAKPLFLVGPVKQAEVFLRRHSADSDGDYRPVGIIADKPGLVGQLVQGVPVMGVVANLGRLVEETRPGRTGQKAVLFLEDPTLELGVSTQLIGQMRAAGVLLLRQPSLAELKQGGGAALREIKLEEFLPREPISLDLTPVQTYVRGKRVLVTGAGGSIGSEICRQLVSFGCSHLTMVDHSEYLLFQIEQEILAVEKEGTCRALLCNVRDAARVRAVFEEEQPEVVFHAAALKHVNLVEHNPCEGVLTNIKGTGHVVEAARVSGVTQMVLISTDKAVDPTSVMGATKRVAEFILPKADDGVRFCSVRFGNVLGSAGSVVPVFRSQIERGGPITLTHEDVERYFMTIPEAVQLVLHATAMSAADAGPEPRKFILEMGRPVKIRELAEKMIEVYGYTAGQEIKIEITGLKPGEKLTERLLDDDEVVIGAEGLVSEIASSTKRRSAALERSIGRLIAAAEAGDVDATRTLLQRVVSAARGAETTIDSEEEAAA